MNTIRIINKEKFMILFQKRNRNYKNGIMVLYKGKRGYTVNTIYKPIEVDDNNIYICSENLKLNLKFDDIKKYKASLSALYLTTKDNREVIINI